MTKTIAKPAAVLAALLCVGCAQTPAPTTAAAWERRPTTLREMLVLRRHMDDIVRVAGMSDPEVLAELETGLAPTPAPRARRPANNPARIDPARKIRA
jgi:hypothetical protein